jgi:hypothetical protein
MRRAPPLARLTVLAAALAIAVATAPEGGLAQTSAPSAPTPASTPTPGSTKDTLVAAGARCDAEAAQLAWSRPIEFFDRALR